MQILVADDSKTNLQLITSSLQKLGHEVVGATSGAQAIELFKLSRPDLIILDVVMEGMDGFECAKKIREINQEDWIPIIFLSGSVDDESISKGIDAGGDDYLTKPFSDIRLAAKIKAMQRISSMRQKLFQATQKLAELSATDTLTGIYNRLQYNKVIQEKIHEAERLGSKFALLFLDLDKFKTINDTLGHPIGDLLLIEVAKRLKNCLRLNDFVARIGGDEFAIILTHIDNDQTPLLISQKIIDLLSKPYHLEEQQLHCSVSIGIVLFPQDGKSQATLTKNADIAMYHAKHSGRNRFQYFQDILGSLANHQEASRMDTKKQENTLSVLNCLIEGSQFCIELDYIKKNVPLMQLDPIPNSPNYLLGFMNLGGFSIPVMDLGVRLNLGRKKPYPLNAPIVVCSDATNQVGFIVDEVLGLYEVSAEDLQMQGYQDNPNAIIRARINIDSKLSLLINMKNLLTSIDYT